MCVVYHVMAKCKCLVRVFLESIHWFDSLLRFLTSIHWFDSLIRCKLSRVQYVPSWLSKTCLESHGCLCLCLCPLHLPLCGPSGTEIICQAPETIQDNYTLQSFTLDCSDTGMGDTTGTSNVCDGPGTRTEGKPNVCAYSIAYMQRSSKPLIFHAKMCKSHDLYIENVTPNSPRAIWRYVFNERKAMLVHFL